MWWTDRCLRCLLTKNQVDRLPVNLNEMLDIVQHCHLVYRNVTTCTVLPRAYKLNPGTVVLVICCHCVWGWGCLRYITFTECDLRHFFKLDKENHFKMMWWYDVPYMSDASLVLIGEIFFLTQTTIIWDAHTGEAKQQFPFHSGKSAELPHVTFDAIVLWHSVLLCYPNWTAIYRSEQNPFFHVINSFHTLWFTLWLGPKITTTWCAQGLCILTSFGCNKLDTSRWWYSDSY